MPTNEVVVGVPKVVELSFSSPFYTVSETREAVSTTSELVPRYTTVEKLVEVPKTVEVGVASAVFTVSETSEAVSTTTSLAPQYAVVDVYVESQTPSEALVVSPVYTVAEELAGAVSEVVPLKEVYSFVDVYYTEEVGPDLRVVVPVYVVSEVLEKLEVYETQPAPAPVPTPTYVGALSSRFKPLADPESLFKALVAVYAPANFEEEQELRRLAKELAGRYSTLADWLGRLRPGDPRELARNPLVVGLIRLLEARVLLPEQAWRQVERFFEGLDPGRTLEKLARGEPLDDSDAVVLERVFLLNDFLSKLQYRPIPAVTQPFAEVFPGYEYALLVLGREVPWEEYFEEVLKVVKERGAGGLSPSKSFELRHQLAEWFTRVDPLYAVYSQVQSVLTRVGVPVWLASGLAAMAAAVSYAALTAVTHGLAAPILVSLSVGRALSQLVTADTDLERELLLEALREHWPEIVAAVAGSAVGAYVGAHYVAPALRSALSKVAGYVATKLRSVSPSLAAKWENTARVARAVVDLREEGYRIVVDPEKSELVIYREYAGRLEPLEVVPLRKEFVQAVAGSRDYFTQYLRMVLSKEGVGGVKAAVLERGFYSLGDGRFLHVEPAGDRVNIFIRGLDPSGRVVTYQSVAVDRSLFESLPLYQVLKLYVLKPLEGRVAPDLRAVVQNLLSEGSFRTQTGHTLVVSGDDVFLVDPSTGSRTLLGSKSSLQNLLKNLDRLASLESSLPREVVEVLLKVSQLGPQVPGVLPALPGTPFESVVRSLLKSFSTGRAVGEVSAASFTEGGRTFYYSVNRGLLQAGDQQVQYSLSRLLAGDYSPLKGILARGYDVLTVKLTPELLKALQGADPNNAASVISALERAGAQQLATLLRTLLVLRSGEVVSVVLPADASVSGALVLAVPLAVSQALSSIVSKARVSADELASALNLGREGVQQLLEESVRQEVLRPEYTVVSVPAEVERPTVVQVPVPAYTVLEEPEVVPSFSRLLPSFSFVDVVVPQVRDVVVSRFVPAYTLIEEPETVSDVYWLLPSYAFVEVVVPSVVEGRSEQVVPVVLVDEEGTELEYVSKLLPEYVYTESTTEVEVPVAVAVDLRPEFRVSELLDVLTSTDRGHLEVVPFYVDVDLSVPTPQPQPTPQPAPQAVVPPLLPMLSFVEPKHLELLDEIVVMREKLYI